MLRSRELPCGKIVWGEDASALNVAAAMHRGFTHDETPGRPGECQTRNPQASAPILPAYIGHNAYGVTEQGSPA